MYNGLPHILAGFAWNLCEHGLAPSTSTTYMRRIGSLYQAAHPDTEWTDLHRHTMLRGLGTRLARTFTDRGRPDARDPAPLDVIRACVDDTTAPIGLLACIGVAFDLCLRLGELLITPLGGSASHVGPLPSHRIRWSGPGYSLVLFRKTGNATTPVTCLPGDPYHHPAAVGSGRLLRAAQRLAADNGWDSPFTIEGSRGRASRAIDADMVRTLLQHHAERLGLPVRLSGHSIRSGSATEAHRCGMPDEFVRALGGWRSDVFRLYVAPLLASNRAHEMVDDDDDRDDDNTRGHDDDHDDDGDDSPRRP